MLQRNDDGAAELGKRTMSHDARTAEPLTQLAFNRVDEMSAG